MIFKSIFAKLSLILGVIVGFLAIMLKLRNSKIDRLEEELELSETKEAIRDDINETAKQAKLEADEEIKDNTGSDWRDTI